MQLGIMTIRGSIDIRGQDGSRKTACSGRSVLGPPLLCRESAPSALGVARTPNDQSIMELWTYPESVVRQDHPHTRIWEAARRWCFA